MLQYGDDFLCFLVGPNYASKSHLLAARRRVEATLATLGLTRNVKKGHWDPTTRLDHLGLTVCTATGQFLVPPAKSERLRRFARDLLSTAKRQRRLVTGKAPTAPHAGRKQK